MSKFLKVLSLQIIFFLGMFIVFPFLNQVYSADYDITIDPELYISRFDPYKIYVANIPNQSDISSVLLNIKTLNGNTVPTSCWNYTVDG